MSLGLLTRAGLFALLLNIQYFYMRQLELNALLIAFDELVLPITVVIVALVFVLRASSGARWSAAARLLGALALMLGAVMLHPVVVAAIFRALFGERATQPSFFLTNSAFAMLAPLGSGFLLGVMLVITLSMLAPRLAPLDRGARLGYWTLAGVLAGIALTFMSQLDRATLLTTMAVRLAAAGATGCTASSGAGCYTGQMFDLARASVLPLLIGAAVGGAAGALLTPAPTEASLQGATPHHAPATPVAAPPEEAGAGRPTERGARGGAMLRYVAGGGIGVLYLALVATLTALALSRINHLTPANPTQSALWGLTLGSFSLLIPAGWLALVGMRARLASALSRGGKRALLWALALLFALLALAVPIVTALTGSLLTGYGFSSIGLTTIIPAAFSLGAAYGLLWSPQQRSPGQRAAWRIGARAAATGWIGVSLPVLILFVGAVYTLVTYSPSAHACHGLACGALLMVVFDTIICGSANIIVLGLPTALAAGGLSAMIREALRAP